MDGCKTADLVPTTPLGSFWDVARWVTGTLGGRDLQRAKLSVLQRRLDERTFATSLGRASLGVAGWTGRRGAASWREATLPG